jgi:hypothetical protein
MKYLQHSDGSLYRIANINLKQFKNGSVVTDLVMHKWNNEEDLRNGVKPISKSSILEGVDYEVSQELFDQVLQDISSSELYGGSVIDLGVTDLDVVKEAKKAQIRRDRDRHINTSISTDLGPIEGDERSQNKLASAVVIGMLVGEGYTVPWAFADGTVKVLSINDLKILALALAQHVTSAYVKANSLIEAVTTASSRSEIGAIRWR